MRVSRRVGLCFVAVLALSGAASTAHADEPVAAREPALMNETAEITSVVDAFDKDDPFDLNIVLGFTQSWKTAKIRRETQLPQNGLEGAPGQQAGFVPATENVASYSSSMSTLNLGVDVGLYRDLALILRLPVILAWSQSLGDLNGSSGVTGQTLADPAGGSLFKVPSTSPTRSGIDTLNFGLDWAIFNQQRDFTKPTWVIGVEGRVAVGAPLHACQVVNGGNFCPNPDGSAGNRDPGISRGYDSVIAKTVWSRRFGYVEPYSGFWVQADFPQGGSDFGKWNPAQDLDRTPPLQGSFALGLEVVPYEAREQFQRLTADLRFKGTYHSPGRDYSELFDALGASQATSLRTPNPASYTTGAGGKSVVDPNAENVFFTGVTEQQAYGSFTLSSSATWQAGAYIKFTAGAGLTYAQSHLITAADVCTPNGNTNPGAAGPCVQNGLVQGVPNPDHRDIIDLPGHRFSIDDTLIVDLYAMGVVMF
ncbi:MAG TPA: hypothetical protein VHS09_10550 [Polyangiaceae bacterium]|nr:hypothetical protein [Polyangiaceae bacterium]